MGQMLRRACLAIVLALALPAAAMAYPWPVRPFNKQHPIRGFFGDPRTVFENGVLAGGFDGPGFFSFHQGVDIAAPDGTPVYPVVSGIAHYLGAATLNVDTGTYQGNARIFQYFHVVPDRRRGRAGDRGEDGARIHPAAVRARAPDGDQRLAIGQSAAARDT